MNSRLNARLEKLEGMVRPGRKPRRTVRAIAAIEDREAAMAMLHRAGYVSGPDSDDFVILRLIVGTATGGRYDEPPRIMSAMG